MGQYYFLMCLVPPLPKELGGSLTMSFGAIAETVKRNVYPDDSDMLYAYLGSVDALNWEQIAQGRDLFFPGGTVSREDMLAGQNLPPFVRLFREEKERGIHRLYPYDRLWELYYEYVLGMAERCGSRFVSDFLGWEVGIRRGLAEQRIRESGNDINNHTLLTSLTSLTSLSFGDFSSVVAKIKSKSNPLAVERYLDEELLRQIYRCEGYSEFSFDALLAYLSRAAIYARWENIARHFEAEIYLFNGGLS